MLKFSFLQSAPTLEIAVIIFFLIIIFYLFGYYLRRRAISKNPEKSKADLGALNGTLLGLLALLLAFTFGMSNSRFDTRRQLIIEEANDIGTVVLRTDIYPDSVRQMLRANLKEYVEARIAFGQAGMNQEKLVEYY